MSSDILDVFREQVPPVPGIELATVVQANPLVIRLDNDKMMLRAEDGDLLACEHLLEHTRQYSTSSQVSGDTTEWQDTSAPLHKHKHEVTSITANNETVTIHYKLQAGDRVVVMALPGGQQYLIWDKVVILS